MKELLAIRYYHLSSDTIFKVPIYKGQTYLVAPPNPKKLKHRGRTCEVIGWDPDSPKYPCFIVKFKDNNRRGKVEINELVPTDISDSLLSNLPKAKTYIVIASKPA